MFVETTLTATGLAAAGNRAEIIRGLFAAYLANDRAAVEAAFAEHFRFSTPYGENIDKPTYFAECWRDSGWIGRHEIERIMIWWPIGLALLFFTLGSRKMACWSHNDMGCLRIWC